LSPGFETPAGAARGETHSFPSTFGSEKALHAKASEVANARPIDVVMLLPSSAQLHFDSRISDALRCPAAAYPVA